MQIVFWTDLEGLKKADNEFYDFENINTVLDQYEEAGAAAFNFDSNWLGKREFDENRKAIATWIEQGQILQAMDVDPYEEKFQEIQPVTFPYNRNRFRAN